MEDMNEDIDETFLNKMDISDDSHAVHVSKVNLALRRAQLRNEPLDLSIRKPKKHKLNEVMETDECVAKKRRRSVSFRPDGDEEEELDSYSDAFMSRCLTFPPLQMLEQNLQPQGPPVPMIHSTTSCTLGEIPKCVNGSDLLPSQAILMDTKENSSTKPVNTLPSTVDGEDLSYKRTKAEPSSPLQFFKCTSIYSM